MLDTESSGTATPDFSIAANSRLRSAFWPGAYLKYSFPEAKIMIEPEWCYRVRARYTDGSEGPPSESTCIGGPRPASPSNPRISQDDQEGTTNKVITMSWNVPSDATNDTIYRVVFRGYAGIKGSVAVSAPTTSLVLVPSPADIGTSIRNELNSGHHTARMFPNMSASKYRVELTESQKRRLSEVAHRGKSPARTVKRALALLKADEGQIDNRIADALSISRRTVVRIRKRFCEEGLESALVERARPGQKRKLDERAEAHLVAIACSDPPEGHAHWTLKLLADKAVELGYVESIARETMRQSLKKTNLSRGRTRRGASRN